MTYQVTSAILGLSIAAIIFYLIRRDHLHTHHAPWWLLLALLTAVLGVFPRLLDWVGYQLNISYPPTLLFSVALGMLLLKVLSIDIHQSRQERRIRRLVQRLALLEDELAERRQQESKTP